MSSCSFASFLHFRNREYTHSQHHAHHVDSVAPLDVAPPSESSAAYPFSPTGSNCSSSSLGSDAASPHKRHRAHSPDPRSTTGHSNSHPSLHSFSTELGTCSFPFSYSLASGGGAGGQRGAPTTHLKNHRDHLPSVESVIASPQPTPLPVRSILCCPSSSPPSSAVDTPLSSPPPTRPVSRRSSTSKSVRFARCTNASVFPTHSTEDYDRSPIIPTCEAQSLELKRSCSADEDADEGGGWIKCVEREKTNGGGGGSTIGGGGGNENKPRLPKNAPNMENPVEGVHGLIEGGFFVGEERDQSSARATSNLHAPPSCSTSSTTMMPGASSLLSVVVNPAVTAIAEDIELIDDEEPLELESETMLVDDSTETVDDDDDDDDEPQQHERYVSNEHDDLTPRRGSILDDTSSASSGGGSIDGDVELRSPTPPSIAESFDALARAGRGGGGLYGSSSHSNASSSSTSSVNRHDDDDDDLRTRGDSCSPDMMSSTMDDAGDYSSSCSGSSGGGGGGGVEDERERARVVKEEKVALKKKQRFGLCSLGKYTRQDVFGTHDSLGGF